jgi:hypothetical protein
MTNYQESNLKTRICNGYIWLQNNQNDKNYPKALELYEELVDKARELGIKEKDCWPVSTMSDNEILEIFKPLTTSSKNDSLELSLNEG